MSATITTQQHRHRVPLATALAIAGVVVAGGALGVAWEQSRDSAGPAETPAISTPLDKGYTQYNYYHGQNAGPGDHKGYRGQSKVPNARIAEKKMNDTFEPPVGGRVQRGL
ncbi:MAG TPA: hypothetical protein VFM08_17190 [Nocardioides sp.]|jgi:hypothetical protein|nr:hypothetical protein [Nocardioides sp.]